MGLVGQRHTRPLYTRERDPVLMVHYKRLCGTLGLSGRVQENSLPPRLDPRTVQPIASRITDCAMHFINEFFDQGFPLLGCDVVQSDMCRTLLIKLSPLLSRYAVLLLRTDNGGISETAVLISYGTRL